MIVSRQIEFPFSGGVDQQRGRVFSALAQDIGRNEYLSLRKCVPPAAKLEDADLLEFALPKLQKYFVVKKIRDS